MNAVTPVGKMGSVSSVLTSYAQQHGNFNDELAAGGGGFAVMSFKGKVWSIKYGGQERALTNPETGEPRFSIEVVIVKARAVKSKIFYEAGFDDTAANSPDCFSNNGVTPDAASPKKQHTNCTLCPHNQFGSSRLANGEA